MVAKSTCSTQARGEAGSQRHSARKNPAFSTVGTVVHGDELEYSVLPHTLLQVPGRFEVLKSHSSSWDEFTKSRIHASSDGSSVHQIEAQRNKGNRTLPPTTTAMGVRLLSPVAYYRVVRELLSWTIRSQQITARSPGSATILEWLVTQSVKHHCCLLSVIVKCQLTDSALPYSHSHQWSENRASYDSTDYYLHHRLVLPFLTSLPIGATDRH